MPTNTVQVPVLMSHSQKLRLARKAKEAKLTMGELLRRGGERYSPEEDPALLDQFARQVDALPGRLFVRLITRLILWRNLNGVSSNLPGRHLREDKHGVDRTGVGCLCHHD